MRIGLIADTHMPGSLDALWPQVVEAFQDVDCIFHAGDLHTLDIVEELDKLAPIYVARGNGDRGIIDDRLRDNWILEVEGVHIGLIHHLPSPERKSPEAIGMYIDRHFDRIPDAVIFGHTHFEGLYQIDRILCVNPGSPTLPRNQSVRMGTLGYLEVEQGRISASIHQITDSGIVPHESIDPMEVSSIQMVSE
ncbi:MAG: YfcE family phosphodiesterase [Pseudomonadales bacterium]|jgi:hypothetical protein|nr:YfcE family phosphodiesterase [Pseudomonadales bacterium]MDP7315946.1 YfcE family phosphodiesterase [Pseudomonadales bacterium]MDP7575375.1 YfcE family phosphodiesterase [Pseudomonadales bacterium]